MIFKQAVNCLALFNFFFLLFGWVFFFFLLFFFQFSHFTCWKVSLAPTLLAQSYPPDHSVLCRGWNTAMSPLCAWTCATMHWMRKHFHRVPAASLYSTGKRSLALLTGWFGLFFCFLKHQSHLSYIIHSVAFPSEGKCLGNCECVSIFFLVNSLPMINCRELYWNPLKLKSPPTWVLRSKGVKHNKPADTPQRAFQRHLQEKATFHWHI